MVSLAGGAVGQRVVLRGALAGRHREGSRPDELTALMPIPRGGMPLAVRGERCRLLSTYRVAARLQVQARHPRGQLARKGSIVAWSGQFFALPFEARHEASAP